MAASFMIFTGRPNADTKSNPTQGWPRLLGSATGLPSCTKPGYPIDTTSYFQSLVICLTPETIWLGFIFGPDGNLRRSFCPVARTLTLVPPTSITNTFMTDPPKAHSGASPALFAPGATSLGAWMYSGANHVGQTEGPCRVSQLQHPGSGHHQRSPNVSGSTCVSILLV